MFKCNQCDFITQNQTLFREHMTRGHVDKPRCPFCLKLLMTFHPSGSIVLFSTGKIFQMKMRVKRFQLLERDLVDTSEMVKESVCLPLGRVNTTTLQCLKVKGNCVFTNKLVNSNQIVFSSTQKDNKKVNGRSIQIKLLRCVIILNKESLV